MWFLLAPNASAVEKKSKEVKCSACKRLVNDLNCQQRRTLKESPTRKLKRQAASSRAKLSCMSPASQQKRKLNAKIVRSSDKLKLAIYLVADIELADEQYEDMCRITEIVEEAEKDELDKLFAEGDTHGVGKVLRNVWNTDLRKQQRQFMNDQTTNVTFQVKTSLVRT